jgi:uncharacterized membrane protein
MDPGVATLALLAVFLVLAAVVFAASAFTRLHHLQEDFTKKISALVSRMDEIEQRLKQIENLTVGRAAGAAETTAAPIEQSAPPAKAPAAAQAPPPQVLPRPIAAKFPELPPVVLAQSPQKAETVESVIAGRWMNYIGIMAMIFSIAFFLKYAFENNWVGPRARVGICLVIGAALFPWSGRLLKKGYRYFSEGIAGLGAAVLYLSLWAGWHYYQLFPQSAAFGMMIVVTAVTATVALRRDSQRMALIALTGGVLTPWLLGTGENHEITLFAYLAVLGAGMLALGRLREWKTLAPIQFLFTLLYFWEWFERFYADDALLPTFSFATIFLLLFATLPVLRSREENGLANLDALIFFSNSFAYLIAARAMLWPDRRGALTALVLALAAGHLAAERAVPRSKGPGNVLARVLFGGLSLTFATLAIPIRLERFWITIAWAIESLILIWGGFRTRSTVLRGAGFVLFLLVLGRLTLLYIPANQFLFNLRFATFAVAVACLLLARRLSRSPGNKLGETESLAFAAAPVAANIYALAAISMEVWDLLGRMPAFEGMDRGLAQQLALSTLWLVYALAFIAAGFRKKWATLRWQALALLGIVIGKVFIFDLSFLQRFYRILSFLFLGFALLLISFYYQRHLSARATAKK